MEAELLALAEKVKTVRRSVCAYDGGIHEPLTCDCKYRPFGVHILGEGGSEVTGCPELRAAEEVLRQLAKERS